MKKFLAWIDELSGTSCRNKPALWLERAAFVFLILMILSAPHSIAATQTAWLLGMTAWLISLFFKPRPKFARTPLNIALWAFFGWTVITSIFSYAPDISIDKLRGTLLFLIFFFVVNNLRNTRAAKFLAFALVFSCMASVLWSPIERIFGRGVEISGVGAESLFSKAAYFDHDTYLKAKGKNLGTPENPPENNSLMPLVDGDAIVEANGRKVRTPDDLIVEIEKNDTTYLECFNPPEYFTRTVKRENLLGGGANSLEKLGIDNWKQSRNWRYGGFYGHVITYAEVLQMITSLVLGLFLASLRKSGDEETSRQGDKLFLKSTSVRAFFKSPILLFSSSPFLLFCLVAMIFALLTTYTRSAQIGFLASAIAIILACGSRKILLVSAIIVLPLTLGGIFLFQQTRNTGFEKKDDSVIYRQTVYREGINLWTSDARKFMLGIGMDSTKRFGKEWHLFDDGRLMTSHFHSTPLQLLVERGLPALLLWFWILWIYARMLRQNLKAQSLPEELRDEKVQSSLAENSQFAIRNPKLQDWQSSGILLGCFGGLIGFFVSSSVNYSLGDGEVAMVFFILMGISVSLVIQNSKFKIQN